MINSLIKINHFSTQSFHSDKSVSKLLPYILTGSKSIRISNQLNLNCSLNNLMDSELIFTANSSYRIFCFS